METFFALLGLCEGIHWAPVESSHKRPVTRIFDVFFDMRKNGWASNWEGGDLRRHRAHYDISVMYTPVQK